MHTATYEQRHSGRFDTALLEQIIAIEVDEAVRGLQERGMTVSSEKQHHWNESLREILQHTFQEESGTHCVLPAEFQESLQCMLQNLIDAEEGMNDSAITSVSSAKTKVPSFLTRCLVFLGLIRGKKVHP